MKKLILAAATLLTVAQAHATVCTLTKEANTAKGVTSKTLFSLDVLKNGSAGQLIVVKPDGEVLENVDITQPGRSYSDLAALDRSIFAVISKGEDGLIAIGTGHVDMRKRDNAIPIDVMAIGNLGKLLAVKDFRNSLSLSCF